MCHGKNRFTYNSYDTGKNSRSSFTNERCRNDDVDAKMRSRRTPTTQAHVTNLRDNPVQIAADAAEAAIRGFDEQETTVAVVRYAPLTRLVY